MTARYSFSTWAVGDRGESLPAAAFVLARTVIPPTGAVKTVNGEKGRALSLSRKIVPEQTRQTPVLPASLRKDAGGLQTDEEMFILKQNGRQAHLKNSFLI